MTHLLMLFFLGLSVFSNAAEPQLSILTDSYQRTWTKSELLGLKELRTISIIDVHTYQGRALNVQAIPLQHLLRDVLLAPDATIEIRTQDGYTKLFTRQRLIDQPPGEAFLAIETTPPWPSVPGHVGSAGPFYLVWKNGQNTTATEWPYQIVAIEIKASLERLYPRILPSADLSTHDPIRKGFFIYKQYCMSCHTINGQGGGEIGPDLNRPPYAIDRYGESGLFRYIRNPQSIVNGADPRMPSYPIDVISDADLGALLLYLKHMRNR